MNIAISKMSILMINDAMLKLKSTNVKINDQLFLIVINYNHHLLLSDPLLFLLLFVLLFLASSSISSNNISSFIGVNCFWLLVLFKTGGFKLFDMFTININSSFVNYYFDWSIKLLNNIKFWRCIINNTCLEGSDAIFDYKKQNFWITRKKKR